MRLLIAACILAAQAQAVQIHIHFGALERMLSEQVFTQEGRRYVRGSKTTKCNFAFLEKPRVRGVNGRLQIKARFTGRTAWDLFGACVGLGDAFDLEITAVPQYRDGNISLTNVTAVPGGRGGFYASRVCSALSSSLTREFKYPLAVEAKRALEAPSSGQEAYKRELRNLNVPQILVTNDALVLFLDFELAVK